MTIWVPYPGLAGAGILVYRAETGPPGPPADVGMWALPHPAPPATLSLLKDMPRVRVVQLLSSGVDHVLPYLPDGVVLCNAPHLRGESTAEAALCLILTSLNGVTDWVVNQRAREWHWLPPRSGLSGRS